ncbi:Polar amino acid transport system permease protein [Bosea sp. 62]|uniref:amino acid ABC transporter permease n=1 Tax=unclassified Bosea (in: a-proteobacteria) TaxID=2653178 RepID=UPI00125C4517|nr:MULTISPECIES: amino acid ABC transporter permease [unclassified Bosea (in: a-proteobacteria)]CAD5253303.1 Polar amino acid transport system permease protein [Bosea sp. 7B]CAD5278002.1 Polar amino acid transport system permease protein [Bosea sp. 21B]CAD5279029.1 Polar amino acid transport system permease protein [Bosea sp. 46]VVT59705.1 Polar amino acid transport system permease protein [Bosea sp. EC-HK365B]VXB40171.1 Polar amino acid transport system permease protein [Bosea sp. 62]
MGILELTYLLQGLLWTLLLAAIGFAGGIVFGVIIALMRVSDSPWLRIPAIGWIGLFQGTPLLMQLFVAYFGLPLLGFDLPAWAAVSVALTAHASAFLGEIWRGAIQAVPRGQSEAADALGLPARSRMFDVIMPQAFKLSLPATVGFLVQLLKGTSLAAIVGFIELTRAGTIVSNQIYKPLLVFGVVGAMYFALCWPLSLWGRRLEQKMAAATAK